MQVTIGIEKWLAMLVLFETERLRPHRAPMRERRSDQCAGGQRFAAMLFKLVALATLLLLSGKQRGAGLRRCHIDQIIRVGIPEMERI